MNNDHPRETFFSNKHFSSEQDVFNFDVFYYHLK